MSMQGLGTLSQALCPRREGLRVAREARGGGGVLLSERSRAISP